MSIKDLEHSTHQMTKWMRTRFFVLGPPRQGSGTEALYRRGLQEVTRFIRDRGGPESFDPNTPPKVVGYLVNVLNSG